MNSVTASIPSSQIITTTIGGTQYMDELRDMLQAIWVASLELMSSQINATMVKQMEILGRLFDAKEQLETQRDFQKLTAQAHKDYHPSDSMCRVGTFSRNLAATDRNADLTAQAVDSRMQARELASGQALTVDSSGSDSVSRLKSFRDTYCNPKDNGNGLSNLCQASADPKRFNKDINFTQTLDSPLTLKIDLTDTDHTEDEQDVLNLVNYLVAHEPILNPPPGQMGTEQYMSAYQQYRSLVAMRGLARNSIAHVIAEKTMGPPNEENAAPFMKSLLQEMGMTEDDIKNYLGERPSYYAQMEVMTKKIYQDPRFYTNLYDKPANVERMRTAMQAIKLMQERDIHDALLRREMLISMILEAKIRAYQQKVENMQPVVSRLGSQ